ncbi:YunC family protein [Bacillus piscicola]|uniref:YunC family protein n=1 Tax=Bacillus piscicola TaxID=1632684 RepID=UPI001F09CA90
MVTVSPLSLDGQLFTATTVELPETTLLIVSGEKGYIMCGALDIEVLNGKYPKRKIAAGRALGVRTIDQLVEAPLQSVSKAAEELGVKAGMTGKDAMKKFA